MSASKKKFISAKLYIALLENKTIEEKKADILTCVNSGADINEHYINDFNNTPLHIAVQTEESELIRFLLDHGVDVNNVNSNKEKALDVAKKLNTDKGIQIVKILEEKIETKGTLLVNNEVKLNTNIENHPKCVYQKRAGVSGIEGQLYETKLLTLVLIRALVNKKFHQFCLGTSLGGIDALDDICIKYQIENDLYIIFLQAKHRKDVNKGRVTQQELWKVSGDFSLPKYFRSYLKIREKFIKTNDDLLYEGRYEDVNCIFAIYTPAKHDLQENRKETALHPTVSDLISSGTLCERFQYDYTDEDINLLKQTILVEDMKYLGMKLFEYKDKYNKMMSDDYIRKYHVVLAKKVFDIWGVATKGFRWGKFRDEFFSSNDELLMTIKETIFRESVSKTNVSKITLKKLIQSVMKDLTVDNLSKLLQNVNVCIELKNNSLKILNNNLKDFNNHLSNLKVSNRMFNNALDIATKEKLFLIHFKFPVLFGNTDIVVKDEKRLNYLAEQIENLISKTENKIIVINKSLVGPKKLIEPGVVEKGGLGTALGNLLILDQTQKLLKFNMNYESLGQNSRKLLKKIKSKIKNLETYRLEINIKDFPKLNFEEECNDINAKDFLNKLWFFTCQAQQDETEKYAKGVLYEYHNENKWGIRKKMSVRSDAIYFKIHDEIQKWWLMSGESQYVTNKSKHYNKILNDFDNMSILNILNFIFTTKMNNYKIVFNDDAMKSTDLSAEIIIIETEVNILTGIKLMQYFQKYNSKYGNCTFIDLDYVLSLSERDCDNVIDEIKNTKLDILIIIFGNKVDFEDVKRNTLISLVSESSFGKFVVVTDIDTAAKIEGQNVTDKVFVRIVDNRNNMIDLIEFSQNVLLEKHLIFQGMEVKWNMIINEQSKNLIKANIVNKIINNEKIEISKMLSNSKYEEIKNCYVPRSLRCPTTTSCCNKVDLSSHASIVLSPYSSNETDKIIVINTLVDLTDIVVLLAAPGMGKSTLLTHLSIATKEQKPGIWIERIDLIDFGFHFKYWRKNQIKINKTEALKFICKIIISKRVQVRYNIEEMMNIKKFDIELRNGELLLKNFEDANEIELLTLEMFIDYYNRRNVILLFDGFDEVCPLHKKEVTLLLNCLATVPSQDLNGSSFTKQKMWITSRSYNNIRRTLENEFGASYILEPFTDIEQEIFMENYIRNNIKLTELTNEQFKTIDGLFEYVESLNCFESGKKKLFKLTDLILRGVYFAIFKYFQSEIKHVRLTDDKKIFVKKWSLLNLFRRIYPLGFSESNILFSEIVLTNREVQKLIQTPLHLYIAIEHLINKIKNASVKNNDITEVWEFDNNTFVFFERFFTEKLKTIRFQEKGQTDLNNSDLDCLYKKEYIDFIDIHKKIAFYSIFNDDFNDILPEDVIIKVKDVINKMESGEEKTGIVDYIINGVPKFVHFCFAEYLAVEYLSDLIKTTQYPEQKKLWMFIIHKLLFKRIRGTLSVFNLKLCNDQDLRTVIMNLNVDVKEFIFNELSDQTVDSSDEEALVILDYAVLNSMTHIAKMLLSVVRDVTNENFDKFNYFLLKTVYFWYTCVDLGFTELIVMVINCARKSDHNSDMSSSEVENNNEEVMRCILKKFNELRPKENLDLDPTKLNYIY